MNKNCMKDLFNSFMYHFGDAAMVYVIVMPVLIVYMLVDRFLF